MIRTAAAILLALVLFTQGALAGVVPCKVLAESLTIAMQHQVPPVIDPDTEEAPEVAAAPVEKPKPCKDQCPVPNGIEALQAMEDFGGTVALEAAALTSLPPAIAVPPPQ